MTGTRILGLGSYVPDRVIDNDEIRFLNVRHERCQTVQTETNDEWIQARTGIRERRYAPDGTATSDLALEAAKKALADAKTDAKEIDCIIFATLSPDIFFPGSGVFLQQKLGVAGENGCACYDIRQQCSGFIYGLQMADAFVKAGMYKRILLVGAEVHSHALDYTTRGRDVAVLFGDGAGAVVLGPKEKGAPEKSGILYTRCGADGHGAMDLYARIYEIKRLPFMDYSNTGDNLHLIRYPQMDGKKVYLQAVRGMVLATKKALAETGMSWQDINWFVPHQANLRINQKVAEVAEIPEEKCLNSIEYYGNTTAATVPLTIDHFRRAGKVKSGDWILSAVFGSGYTVGAAIFQV
jgi:3-oxoacyl-[acyl-carrier-protein] synthase-3